jgi:prepilin-type N-terminal cleavage/methylation domain-containing protein
MIGKSGKWKGERGNCRRGAFARDFSFSLSPFPFRISPYPLRPGMTLIELLVAISIIATLSAMFLGASRAAMEHSRAARTRTTIDKLHTLVMERYADYETRRIDLDSNVATLLKNPNMPAEGGHDLRLLALRELMKFEMPDRWSDIDISLNPMGKTASRDQATAFIENVPPITRIYYRRYDQALANANDEAKVNDNQGAECLYMMVMLHTGDGEARTMFSAQDIGDVDEDGLPEFLDGWGRPIGFVRWPAGFVMRSSLMTWDAANGTGDSANDHDPFDPFRRNWVNDVGAGDREMIPPPENFGSQIEPYIKALRGINANGPTKPSKMKVGFRTVPLIYSAGPDGEPDIITAKEIRTSENGLLNPYFPTNEDDNYSMGSPHILDGEDLSIDNIHNHLDTTR